MQRHLHTLRSLSQGEVADRDHNRSSTPGGWTFQPLEDLQLHKEVILVAKNGH